MDLNGNHVKKSVGSTTTNYYPFGHYELENGTARKHYFFGSQRIAMKSGTTLTYLHADHLGSTAVETVGSSVTASQKYCAYGHQRTVSGSTVTCGGGNSLATDHTFTGQKQDDSGLTYMNARYYDPSIGTFVSPDTIVPDVGNVFDYNRFMYVRGNAMNAVDPSGHYSDDEIMSHFGCSEWACVENIFRSGGDFAGLWGWLYTLQMAQDGDTVTAASYTRRALTGYNSHLIQGRFHLNSDGKIEIVATRFSGTV